MLTPRFSLTQDDSSLTVTIYAPFTNLSETEVFIEDDSFRFFSKPYFLRLHLPGEIEENETSTGKYDADTCNFVIKVSKKVPGQHFEGLELLSELLKPKGATSAASKVEVVNEANNEDEEGEVGIYSDDEEQEWYIDQVLPSCDSADVKVEKSDFCYGFGFQRSDVFDKLLDEFQEILDIKNPDTTTFSERRAMRIEMERNHFDCDHYLCDLFEDEDIKRILEQKLIWDEDLDDEDVKLSQDEKDKLMALPNSLNITVEKNDLKSVFYGLLDIVFAYLYDYRVSEGEHSTESGWNISKLSSTLSCCEKFTSMVDVVIACARRSLIYPLYRHWKLVLAVFRDLSNVLRQGKTSLLKVLLKCIKIFTSYEGRYIFNELYINQYARWIQVVKSSDLKLYANSLDACIRQLKKSDLQLDLDDLEAAARIVATENDGPSDPSTKSYRDLVESSDSDDSETEDSESSSDSEVSSESSDSETSSSSDTESSPLKTNNETKSTTNSELDQAQVLDLQDAFNQMNFLKNDIPKSDEEKDHVEKLTPNETDLSVVNSFEKITLSETE